MGSAGFWVVRDENFRGEIGDTVTGSQPAARAPGPAGNPPRDCDTLRAQAVGRKLKKDGIPLCYELFVEGAGVV
ncbi:hypothetical protein ACFFQF_10475 [Haladaptatus pallidirubidus]|uniref:hypothetical protein n=1 Tax=Haladaptatus pallidirubidus TaxID=1008152 RepID=UPI0035F0B50A